MLEHAHQSCGLWGVGRGVWGVRTRSVLLGGHSNSEIKSGVLRDKNSTKSPAWWSGALPCWKVKKSSATERIGIFHIGNLCFWVPFLKQLLLRNCAVDFAEICKVYSGKMIIKAVKRIFNLDKIRRSYSDLNLASLFWNTVYTRIAKCRYGILTQCLSCLTLIQQTNIF